MVVAAVVEWVWSLVYGLVVVVREAGCVSLGSVVAGNARLGIVSRMLGFVAR